MRKGKTGKAGWLPAVLLLTACGAVETKTGDWMICRDPRPQICTMEYLPVCGETREGERVTHASGCSACARPEILRYRAGACI